MTDTGSAERMRLHRERRRHGLRCVTIELRESEISTLVRLGFLAPEAQDKANAVTVAVHKFLDRSLGQLRVTPGRSA